MPYYGGTYVPEPYRAPAKPRGVYTKGPIPKPRAGKPRGVYTKGSTTSQGKSVGGFSGIGRTVNKSFNAAKTVGRTVSKSPPAPKLAKPKARSNPYLTAGGGSSGGIQLPGTGSSSMASIYRRTEAQLKAMAREAVLLEVNPQLNTLNLARATASNNYNYLINTLRKNLGLSKGDISQLYSTLDVALQSNAQEQAKITAKTKGELNQVYDKLNTQVGENYGKAQTATADELKRMGLQNPQANDRLTNDQQFLQGLAQSSKANAGALQDAIGASTQGLMTGLRGGSQATGNMLQGQLQLQFNKETADALKEHQNKAAEIDSQRNTLKNSVQSKINQTYAALLDQQYQREMDAAQRLFDNQIKLGNFQLGQQSEQRQASYQQNSLALEAQKIANQSAKDKAAAATKTKGPIGNTGMEKALSYIQNLSYVKGKKVPYGVLENILIDAINGDPNRTGNDAYPGYEKARIGQYANDIRTSVSSRGLPSGIYTDLVNAMQYFFGNR